MTLTVLLVAGCSAWGAQAASAATLKGDYRFANTRESSCCGAPALVDIGPSQNSFFSDSVDGSPQTALAFPTSNGLSLATGGVIPPDSFSFVMQFNFVETGGYRRILDLKGGSSDQGLYNLSGQLNFYPSVTGSANPPPFVPNKYVEAVITRDGPTKQVVGYIDGVRQFSLTDSDDAAVISAGTARFFKDDAAVSGEESAGAVARIRVYEGALSAAEVAALSRRKLADLPPPALGREVNVEAASGRVLVGVPARGSGRSGARASQKGLRFVPLSEARQIPIGSFLNTTRGTVRLQASVTRRGKDAVRQLRKRPLPGAPVAQAQRQGPHRHRAQGLELQPLPRPRLRPRPGLGSPLAAHDPPGQRQRPRPLPHPRPLQRSDGARHQVDHDRPLRRHPHQGHPRQRQRARHPPPQDDRRQGRQELPRQSSALDRGPDTGAPPESDVQSPATPCD